MAGGRGHVICDISCISPLVQHSKNNTHTQHSSQSLHHQTSSAVTATVVVAEAEAAKLINTMQQSHHAYVLVACGSCRIVLVDH
jgi:hypothetical protein